MNIFGSYRKGEKRHRFDFNGGENRIIRDERIDR